MVEFLFGLVVMGAMAFFDQLPQLVAKVVLVLAILFSGGIAGVMGYGCLRALIEGNWLFAGILFLVFGLFFGVMLKCLLKLVQVNHVLAPRLAIGFKLVQCGFVGCFFLGLFGLLVVDTFAPIVPETMPIWRRVGLLLLAAGGAAGYGWQTIKQLKALLSDAL